jgi:hypothetical protein
MKTLIMSLANLEGKGPKKAHDSIHLMQELAAQLSLNVQVEVLDYNASIEEEADELVNAIKATFPMKGTASHIMEDADILASIHIAMEVCDLFGFVALAYEDIWSPLGLMSEAQSISLGCKHIINTHLLAELSKGYFSVGYDAWCTKQTSRGRKQIVFTHENLAAAGSMLGLEQELTDTVTQLLISPHRY